MTLRIVINVSVSSYTCFNEKIRFTNHAINSTSMFHYIKMSNHRYAR